MKKPTMPNIRARNLPSGKATYFLDYYDVQTDARVRLTIGPRKRDAQEKAKEIYDEMMARYIGAPSLSHMETSIADLVEAFFQSRVGRNAKRSIVRYRILAKHFTEFMHNRFPTVLRVSEVQRVHVEKLLNELHAEGQEPRTLNAELAFLKMLFKFGVDEGYTMDSPVQRIKPFRQTNQAEAVQFWSEEEVRNILSTVRPIWKDAFEFLYYTGLRKGELIHLTWDDVNLNGSQPSIKVQAKEDWETKTLNRRIVPLNRSAVEIIKRQKRSTRHKFVFSGPEGGAVHPDKIYKELKKALGVLKLEGDVHQFRHTFASHLVMKGAGLETVSKLLGHTSIEMTMKYAHLAPYHLQTAVNLLPVMSDK